MSTAPKTLPEKWFGSPPEPIDGEQWLAHYAANRTQKRRAVGGRLYFTTHRVLFCPNVIDSRLGGKSWSCRLSDVQAIGVEPRRFSLLELFSGGLAERLRLELRDGTCELFVIGKPADRMDELRSLLVTTDSGGRAVTFPLPEVRVVKE